MLFVLWDTAGQEQFHSITKTYCRNTNYAVICFDPQNEKFLNSIKYWVSFVKEECDSVKIILAATKYDCYSHQPEIVKRITKAKGYSDQIFATSSLTGEGVSDLFEKIVSDFDENSMNSDNKLSESRIMIEQQQPIKKNNCC